MPFSSDFGDEDIVMVGTSSPIGTPTINLEWSDDYSYPGYSADEEDTDMKDGSESVDNNPGSVRSYVEPSYDFNVLLPVDYDSDSTETADSPVNCRQRLNFDSGSENEEEDSKYPEQIDLTNLPDSSSDNESVTDEVDWSGSWLHTLNEDNEVTIINTTAIRNIEEALAILAESLSVSSDMEVEHADVAIFTGQSENRERLYLFHLERPFVGDHDPIPNSWCQALVDCLRNVEECHNWEGFLDEEDL